MTHSRARIAALLDEGGLHPRRDLGQNFVTDPNTVRKIANLAAVGPDDHVVEIGAGLGSLTLALAETGARVTAIEVDKGIIEPLTAAVAKFDNVTVIAADARTVNWSEVLAGADAWTLVANLPYNIGTPLVCDVLDDVPQIERMLVMVQREVAERFAASPGTKDYGAVSVKVAYWADAKIVGYVPASVFLPRPKVESALVLITRHRPPELGEEPLGRFAAPPVELFALVQRAFRQRRKMLRRSLADVTTPEVFDEAGIDPTRRAETLDLADWMRLAAAINRTATDG